MSEECNTIWSISHLVITSILMLIALPLLMSFIKRYVSSDKKLNISLLLILSLFTFETFCTFLFAMYQDIYCVDILPSYAQYDTLEFSQAILVAVYWTQSYFVSLLFYIRLYIKCIQRWKTQIIQIHHHNLHISLCLRGCLCSCLFCSLEMHKPSSDCVWRVCYHFVLSHRIKYIFSNSIRNTTAYFSSNRPF
eukprot:249049_1